MTTLNRQSTNSRQMVVDVAALIVTQECLKWTIKLKYYCLFGCRFVKEATQPYFM